jgi:hypothetical protein
MTTAARPHAQVAPSALTVGGSRNVLGQLVRPRPGVTGRAAGVLSPRFSDGTYVVAGGQSGVDGSQSMIWPPEASQRSSVIVARAAATTVSSSEVNA